MNACYLFLLIPMLLALVVGCGGPYDLEPTAEPGAPVDPGRPNGSPTPPPPSPTPTHVVRPVGTATPVAFTTPTTTPGPPPTETPVPPFPGFVYRNDEGLWQVGADWQPQHLSTRPDAQLSPDGQRLLYLEDGDVFLQDLDGGEAVNVTAGSGREHLYAEWWSARSETLVLMSRERGAAAPNAGHLTLVGSGGEGYRVVSETASNAHPAPGPDGRTIAYDEAGTAMLYDVEAGAQPFDPESFNLPAGVIVPPIASPAWSPDGGRLAWMMALQGGENGNENGWDVVVGVFDLQEQTAMLIHPFRALGRGGWFPAPAWSPDGRWLTFHAETDDGMRGLWVAAADGSSERQLTQQLDSRAFWSPPGSESWQNGDFIAISPAPLASGGDYLLIQTGSWYQVPLYVPDGGVVVDWRATAGAEPD